MPEQFARTELILGQEAMDRLRRSRVAVFGIGGVGGYVVEALARSGVGSLDIIDHDKVSMTNINRQIIASTNTVGRDKVDVMKERILSINLDAVVNVSKSFFLPETADLFDFGKYTYVVDAIDTVTAKIELVLRAGDAGVPVISCMGTGNKLEPAMLEIADIYQTSVCPLAKVMRRELRKRNVEKLKVLYSKEEPVKNYLSIQGRAVPGSVSFVPSVAGLIIASEVIKEIAGISKV